MSNKYPTKTRSCYTSDTRRVTLVTKPVISHELGKAIKHRLTYVYICPHAFSRAFNLFGFMALNATFNNISVISWRSTLLVKEKKKDPEFNLLENFV